VDIAGEISEVLEDLAKAFPEKKSYMDFMSSSTRDEMEQLAQQLAKTNLLGSQEFKDAVRKEILKREPHLKGNKELLLPAVSVSILILLGGAVVGALYYQRVKKAESELESAGKKLQDSLLKNFEDTEWLIELTPEKAKYYKEYPGFDRLIFKRGMVLSNYFLTLGFTPASYNFVLQKNGKASWEAMQKNLAGDTVTWRAEVEAGRMKGEFKKRSPDGQLESVSFRSPGYYKMNKE